MKSQVILTAALLATLAQCLPNSSSTSPKTTASASAAATGPANPYQSACPLPDTYHITNFVGSDYDSDTGSPTISLDIVYGPYGTFHCPYSATSQDYYNGNTDMNCDPDGLVRVITDGLSYIWVQEWFWCDAVPLPHDSYATLATYANDTTLASQIKCTIDDDDEKTCVQSQNTLPVLIQTYESGGIIGFEPININGTALPNCPTPSGIGNPIVTDVATCAHAGNA